MDGIDRSKLLEIIARFKDQRVLVIGDVMLDVYEMGIANRISPEAPVPVVRADDTRYVLGGAANTANNIVALQGQSSCVGVVGNDDNSNILERRMQNAGIFPQLIREKGRKTTSKTRVIAHKQQVVRIDKEDDRNLDPVSVDALMKLLENECKDHDAIVVSDYAKGMISEEICQYLIKAANKKEIPLIIDPRPAHVSFYKGAYLVTPNTAESLLMAGKAHEKAPDIDYVGSKLRTQLRSNILITQGEEGMTLYVRGKKPKSIPTKAYDVSDVTGAGDTVVSTMGLAIAAGASLYEAAIIANYAAGVVCEKLGTATCSQQELIQAINQDKK